MRKRPLSEFRKLAVPAVVVAAVLAALLAPRASAQEIVGMEQRVEQLHRTIAGAKSCAAVEAALDLVPGTLWGGLRPVVSKDLLEPTRAAHRVALAMERKIAGALGELAASGRCEELAGRALDLKIFIEEIGEVAEAVGQVTARCGLNDPLNRPPCDELMPLLDEETGHEIPAGADAQRATAARLVVPFSVKLRGPFVPPWIRFVEEDVRVTDPIAPGECVVVFKEFKGLMLRLRFERIVVVTDPWVVFFGQPRGTPVPIWRLDWIFSEYVKEWNICNHDGKIDKSVTQRVKQDLPLNFFWRYYRKDP